MYLQHTAWLQEQNKHLRALHVWAFWFPLPGRCNWWRWMIWEIQAPELSSAALRGRLRDYNIEMSHQPCGWQSAHPVWSCVFVIIFYLFHLEKACLFSTTPCFRVTEIYVHSSLSVFMWVNIFSGNNNFSCRQAPTPCSVALCKTMQASASALMYVLAELDHCTRTYL